MSMFGISENTRQRIIGGVGICLVLFAIFASAATPVFAQIPTPVGVVADGPREIEKAQDEVELNIAETILVSTVNAAFNGINFFIRKVALDTAKYLGEGLAGRKSAIFKNGVGEYMRDAADGAVGEAIATIGEPFGLNLCQIPDVRLQLFLQIGIGEINGYGSPTPRCTFTEFTNNWSAEGFERKFGKGASKLIPQKFSDVVSVKQSDFGLAFGAIAQVDALRATAQKTAELERTIGNGFRDLKDKVSDTIMTPAKFLAREADSLSADAQLDKALLLTTGSFAAGAAQVIPAAVQTFLGSFITSLLDQTLQQGLFQPSVFDPNFFGVGRRDDGPSGVLSDLRTPQILSVPEYDVLLSFVSCPQNPKLDNCVMDQNLFQALTRGSLDKPMTIREAMDAGLLHGDWPLISPRREVAGGSGNTEKDCYSKAYCYSNIQKLRKARILPLGFEIAALKADPDNPQENWTLRRVVDNFDNCSPDGRTSAQFPYCHLINPNWVLRSFSASCPSRVTGPNLVTPQSPTRAEECADIATCIATNPDGSCATQGYCTKEQNVWRLKGDECVPEYATCRTYRNSTGETNSYLTRTIDFSTCTADTVGCRAFSAEQNAQGAWIPTAQANLTLKTTALGRNQALFINQVGTEKTCNQKAEGCHAFFTALRTTQNGQFVLNAQGGFVQAPVSDVAYLKKAPEYLGCYDTNRATPEVNWPRTSAEAQAVLASNSACGLFAAACSPQEVGCESYRPVNDRAAPAIPGRVGANTCAQVCVGYDTFRQEATVFDPAEFPLHFIPSNGQKCQEQYAGCSEFTNIDTASRGGEGREYYTNIRRCERPQVNPGQTYYSWEGSDREGYVLQVHTLVALDGQNSSYVISSASAAGTISGVNYNTLFAPGGPAYADDNGQSLRTAATRCNEANYTLGVNDPINPNRADVDCRALYDVDGQVYYRLLSQTVAVTSDCSRLRKTESSFYIDALLRDSASCSVRGGSWDASQNTCRRCAAGGRVENGACVYQAQTTNGQSARCPASANNCRVYVGNTGRNVFATVVNDSFEGSQSPSSLGWASVPANAATRIAGEAVLVGEHSLGVPVAATRITRTVPQGQVQVGKTFTLSFWARADGLQNLDVSFTQGGSRVNAQGVVYGNFTAQGTPAAVTGGWQEINLGPVTLDGIDPTAPLLLEFVRTGNNQREFFLDYVQLIELRDRTALIRNSWRVAGSDVPGACDSTPTDAFPGEALGCRAYSDSKNRTVYATGFETICREAAVGCEPVWDTQNTLGPTPSSTYAQASNVWCDAPGGATCSAQVAGVEYTCTVARGQEGCYLSDTVVIPPGTTFPVAPLRVVNTTVVIPADTLANAPIFLTNKKEFECRSSELGCQKVALETRVLPRTDAAAYTFNESYILNNPALYTTVPGNNGTGILCQAEQVGCAEFRSDNTVTYFRDPEATGAGVCEYLTGQVIGQSRVNGWFLRGVGQCSQDAALTCRANDDCGVGNTCNTNAKVACDPTFLRRTSQGLVYDVRSNDSPEYEGRVASCPATAHLCTEFIDPQDRGVNNQYPEGRPYYVKNNDKIRARAQACATGASQVEGCILFDQTDNPRKTYSTDVTYRASASANPQYSPVAPRSAASQTDNDANIVLKVDRDRTCAEWLGCKGKIIQEDDEGNKYELCYDYKACDEMGPGGVCTHWLGDETQEATRQLSEELYIQRELGWNDPEYSGYSLFNQYQIGSQSYIIFDLSGDKLLIDPASPNAAEDLARLERFEAPNSFAVYIVGNASSECTQTNPGDRTDWRTCGPNAAGRCYAGQCIRPTKGAFPQPRAIQSGSLSPREIERLLSALEPATCKAYPEPTAPFPSTVVNENTNRASEQLLPLQANAQGAGLFLPRSQYLSLEDRFTRANVCQSGQDCSCEYRKITYRNGTVDYWPASRIADGTRQIPQGICADGINAGRPCTENAQCGTNNECSFIQKDITSLGLRGFCLERDYSRRINGLGPTPEYACLTWLPIQVSASTFDVFNADDEAGYKPDIDGLSTAGISGQFYCSASTRLGVGLQSLRVNPNDAPSDFDITSRADTTRLLNTHIPNQAFGGDCRAAVLNHPYMQLFCNMWQTEEYAVLQSWALNNIGPSSLVLRLDTPPERAGSDNDFGAFALYDLNQPTENQSEVYQPFHFAPTFEGDANIAVNDDEDSGSFGTLLHPPRQWDATRPAAAAHDYRYRDQQTDRLVDTRYFGIPSTANRSPYAWGATSQAVTPQSILNPADFPQEIDYYRTIGNRYIVQRHEASALTRFDLHRVAFVPLAFPGGAEGMNPAILSTEFAINFTELDRIGPQGENGSNTIFRSTRGTFFGAGLASSGDLFSNNTGSQIAYTASYKKERCLGNQNTNCIGSFSDYGSRPDTSGWLYDLYQNDCLPNGPQSNTARCNRNRIDSRYVSIFFTDRTQRAGVQLPSFVVPASTDQNASIEDRFQFVGDPFDPNTQCITTGSDGQRMEENWLAIGMDFNAGGEFLGFVTRWCNSTPESDEAHANGIMFATVAELADQCTEFVQTYNVGVPLTDQTNKAWTNRVWEHALNFRTAIPGQPVRQGMSHPTIPNNVFLKDTQNVPFASLAPFNGSLSGVTDQELRTRTFRSTGSQGSQAAFSDGIPYACEGTGWNGFGFMANAFSGPCSGLMRMQGSGNTPDTNLTASLGTSVAQGRALIEQLFAQSFVRRVLQPRTPNQNGNDAPIYAAQAGLDQSRTLNENAALLAPQIFSLNPATCLSPISGGARRCTPGEQNNLTVNDRNSTMANYDNSADGSSDEDRDRSGAPDPIIAIGSMPTRLQFFAMADDNKMPVRQVRVDWGDGSLIVNESQEGLYKNRKPFCSDPGANETAVTVGQCGTSANNLTLLTCRTHTDCPPQQVNTPAYRCFGPVEIEDQQDLAPSLQFARFGNSTRACVDRPFTFVHDYSCSATDINAASPRPWVVPVSSIRNPDTRVRLSAEYGLNSSEMVCVFRPRVQVKDNWGWCNSVNPDGTVNPRGVNNGTDTPGLNDDVCDSMGDAVWTRYTGEIVVIPPRAGQ